MARWPYDSARWRKLRLLKLQAVPLCEHCADIGMMVAANTVDHRRAISNGGEAFPLLADLASLCAPCHSAKTARGPEAGAVRTWKPRKGCTPDGAPLDRSHPWHAKQRLADARADAKRSAARGADASQEIAPAIAAPTDCQVQQIVS